MKKKNMKIKKSKQKKNLFEKARLEMKSVRVEDIIFILLLATGILILLGFIAKKDILSIYFVNIYRLSPIYYFDLVVRNGILKYIYFALVTAVVYWLAKKIIKKKFNIARGVSVNIIGLIIAYLIYLLPPFYLDDVKPLPGSFWDYPTEDDINKTSLEWCGDRVDFIFSHSSELGVKMVPVIQEVREQGIPINMYCLGDTWINDDIVCRKKYNLNPREGEKKRDELGVGKGGLSKTTGLPAEPKLVIGCKYYIEVRHNITVTRDFICEKTELC
ncbi:hypothetical protein KY348_07590 [Candidatus Woesearchaeota archaeon]|nr:hypothetical protein [Candidatus Woesearchaeota archaeon]